MKHLISNNNKRYIKEAKADRKEGEEVVIHGFKSKNEQNQAILNFLRKKQELKELHKTALIYRTNSGAAAMAEKLLTCQIPFRLKEKLLNPLKVGGSSFWILNNINYYFDNLKQKNLSA